MIDLNKPQKFQLKMQCLHYVYYRQSSPFLQNQQIRDFPAIFFITKQDQHLSKTSDMPVLMSTFCCKLPSICPIIQNAKGKLEKLCK